jgi:hypothetical protein
MKIFLFSGPSFFARINAFLIVGICFLFQAGAATRYVDGHATGRNNGESWTDAWTSLTAMEGISPGDFVYISGGSAGSSQTYALNGAFSSLPGFASGRPDNNITYQIGRDPAHNGTAIFKSTNSQSAFVGSVSHVIISGDVGDGAMHFSIIGFRYLMFCQNVTDLRVSFIDCGEMPKFALINPGNRIELDHCRIKIIDMKGSNAVQCDFKGHTWDQNRIHHCTISIPNNGSGYGVDGIVGAGTGFSLHDNTIAGYIANYTGGQHQDGWQALGGSYIKIYNNTFTNIANYPVFGDAFYGDFSHLWIYNNVIFLTDAKIQTSNPQQGIAVGPDGGAFRKLKRWPTFSHVIIANNIVVDYGRHAAVNLQNNPGQHSTFVDCMVVNNVYINSGGIGLDAAVRGENNVELTPRQARKVVRNYAPLTDGNDLHLRDASHHALSRGTNLSPYFKSDKNGDPRPSEGAWTVGPYEAAADLDASHDVKTKAER